MNGTNPPYPKCVRTHHETLLAVQHPPNRFIPKARADGVRAITTTIITTPAISTPYWNRPLQASVVDNHKAYPRLRSQHGSPPPAPTPRASLPSSPSTS